MQYMLTDPLIIHVLLFRYLALDLYFHEKLSLYDFFFLCNILTIYLIIYFYKEFATSSYTAIKQNSFFTKTNAWQITVNIIDVQLCSFYFTFTDDFKMISKSDKIIYASQLDCIIWVTKEKK